MKVPHLVQYQGSKRIIAPEIIKFFPDKINRLIEPFSGACAISILAAAEHKCNQLAKRTSQLRKVSGRTKTAEKLNRRMIGRYGMKCYLYGEKVKAYLRRGARNLLGFEKFPNLQVVYVYL